MITVMNLLYRFRGSINSTSSRTMPKPAVITQKSGSIWFGHTDYMDDVGEGDETVDPIWIFGYKFYEREDDSAILLERVDTDENDTEEDSKTGPKKHTQQLSPIDSIKMKHFHEFAKCTLWFSYRREFVPIEGSKKIKSDAGWGCMIRTAQMMVAEALVRKKVGDEWKLRQNPLNDPTIRSELQSVISLFGDNDSFPLSLHNIVYTGAEKYRKKPGEWFGPATVSHTLRDIIIRNDEKLGITAYTADNGLISVKDILKLLRDKQMRKEAKEHVETKDHFFRLSSASSESGSKSTASNSKTKVINWDEVEWSPFIIFIPIKAGMETVHPSYIPSLESLFMIPQSIGVIGGKPYSSFYFIAGQGEVLHFLDPHFVQEYVPIPPDKASYEIKTWTNPEIRWIRAVNVDATFSAGFFIKDKEDFIKFETISKFIFTKVQPLFSFEDGLVSKESLLSCSSSSSHSSVTSHKDDVKKRNVSLNTKSKATVQKQEKEHTKTGVKVSNKKDLSLSVSPPDTSTHIAIGQPQKPTTETFNTNNNNNNDGDDDDDFEIIL